jgi:hypothetical protein
MTREGAQLAENVSVLGSHAGNLRSRRAQGQRSGQTCRVRALEVQPCRSVCTWAPSGELLEGLPLFVCGGCGSEWVRTQAWTPIGADGVVSAEVAEEAARRR